MGNHGILACLAMGRLSQDAGERLDVVPEQSPKGFFRERQVAAATFFQASVWNDRKRC